MRPGEAFRWAPLLALLAALGIALLLLPEANREFGDGGILIRQCSASPAPYYNFAYRPMAHVAIQIGQAAGVESPARSMLILSRLATVAGGLGLAAMLRLLRVGTWSTAGAVALALTAPAAVLFNALVEVHALAFAGAAWSLVLALCAGRSAGAGRLAWLLAALAVAASSHMGHVLLMPALLWTALGDGPLPRPLRGRTGWIVAGGVALALGAGLVAHYGSGFTDRWAGIPMLSPIGSLFLYGRAYFAGLVERGAFTPLESWEYVAAEWIAPAGVLTLGVLALLPRVVRGLDPLQRRFLIGAALTSGISLLIYSQGGVWERGGYALSFWPFFAYGTALALGQIPARGRGLAIAALVALQVLLAWRFVDRFLEEEPDFRPWANSIAGELRSGDRLLVSSQEKKLAIPALATGVGTTDVRRSSEEIPERNRVGLLRELLLSELAKARAGGRLLVESGILELDAQRVGWAGAWQELFEDPRLELRPIEGTPGLTLVGVKRPAGAGVPPAESPSEAPDAR